MHVTSVMGLAGLVVVGIIAADVLTHPTGTTAAANGIVNVLKPTESSLLGVAPK